MITTAFVLVLVLAVLARLAVVVRHDRPSSAPRSHAHEVAASSPRSLRVV